MRYVKTRKGRSVREVTPGSRFIITSEKKKTATVYICVNKKQSRIKTKFRHVAAVSLSSGKLKRISPREFVIVLA